MFIGSLAPSSPLTAPRFLKTMSPALEKSVLSPLLAAQYMSITGVTPEYGLLLEQNRAGDVLIQVEADVDSEYDYELLGYITPKKMGQAYHCPVFNGLSKQTTS